MSAQSPVDLSTSAGTKGERSSMREYILFIHYDQEGDPHTRAHDRAVIYGATFTHVWRSLGAGLPALPKRIGVYHSEV